MFVNISYILGAIAYISKSKQYYKRETFDILVLCEERDIGRFSYLH